MDYDFGRKRAINRYDGRKWTPPLLPSTPFCTLLPNIEPNKKRYQAYVSIYIIMESDIPTQTNISQFFLKNMQTKRD